MPTKTKLEADIDDLIKLMDKYESSHELTTSLSPDEVDLIIDALVFYKEMNTY